MGFAKKIKLIIKMVMFPNSYSEERFINYLKKLGIDIGEGCKIWSPNQVHIDVTRPHMLHIGDYVKITRNVTVLCHDYSRSVFVNYNDSLKIYENVGECAYTYIGNNVFIGVNSTILMGTHIGNNCIVGAGSVVSGSFPDNVVIAGNPAKVICSIDSLYKKKKNKQIESAKLYANQWYKLHGKYPNINEMTNAFAWLYLPHNQDTIKKYPKLFSFSGVDKILLSEKFKRTKSVYNSFEEFLEDCKTDTKKH